jgi:phenylpyruvate tautomerase PptA (4-oxalocrotonate tautomerase family)
MPMIQIDVQPLSNEQRAELRSRVIAAVSGAIGSPYPYISIVIRESEPPNLVEAGGWGAYDRRELIHDPRSASPAVEPAPAAGGAAKQAARG